MSRRMPFKRSTAPAIELEAPKAADGRKYIKNPGHYTREAEFLKALIWKEKVKKRARIKQKIVRLSEEGCYTDKQIAKIVGTSTANIERTRRALGMSKPPVYKGETRLTNRQWTWLNKNYLKYSDAELAERLGYASAQTIGQFRRNYELKKGHKGKWNRAKHPKGFKGFNHSQSVKLQQSIRSKAMWADPTFKLHNEKYKQEVSDRMSKLASNRLTKNIYSNAKRGYRSDLGEIFFRSKWEANIARYLNLMIAKGNVFKWEFESETFWFEKIKRGVRSYTPDFKVWRSESAKPYFIEVKGYMDAKSKTKLSRMARYFPEIQLILIDQKEYKLIERQFKSIIHGWEP